MLDDEANFFQKHVLAGSDALPAGLQPDTENAPIGPGRTQANYYPILTLLPGEKPEAALDRFKKWAATLPVDQDHEIGYGRVWGLDDETEEVVQKGWRGYYLWAKADITGDMVSDAQKRADESDTGLGGWNVSIEFTPKGAEIFEQVTGANVKKRFAIILDGKVESAPVINEKIAGGSARITMGAGTLKQQLEDAAKLELVLRSGALPAPIAPSNEQRIGASLGRDAISDGLKAALAGSALVLGLILFLYRGAGVVTSFAVLFNLSLQIALLAMFGASMTLPGICGLALTVGMSVDANVLINERIREELKAGKSPRSAVQLGYDRAFSAILDGNVTTLIAALILAQYGTGPIKGFAVTLIIGMLCNLFTGVVATRLFFELWTRRRTSGGLSIGA
jgi:preprotein translocase subunit SecD